MAEDYELFMKISAIRKVRAEQSVIALYRIHQFNNSILNLEKSFRESVEIVSRYLSDPVAIRGLRRHHTYYAISQIRNGKPWIGIYHLVVYGSLWDLFSSVRIKMIDSF